jgi:hypothetical protein
MPAPLRAIAPFAALALLVALALVTAGGASASSSSGSAASAASLAAGSSSAPTATAARRCRVAGRQRRLGASYVTRIDASGISCSGAYAVVRGYHRCRKSRGGADGRCPRFNGWRCSEGTRRRSPTQYDARAICRKSGRSVSQRYTQNT